MILKESFAYQNKISGFIDKAVMYLTDSSNVTIKTQTHFKNKVWGEAVDETKVVATKSRYGFELDFDVDNTKMVLFLEKLLDEKVALSEAVSLAKKSCDIDIDVTAATNKVRQQIANVLDKMSSIKAVETDTTATDYKFNQEGNQVPYCYPVKEVTTIDFDRNVVRKLSKSLYEKADALSTSIEAAQATTVVDFTPAFGLRDTFEDAYNSFVGE